MDVMLIPFLLLVWGLPGSFQLHLFYEYPSYAVIAAVAAVETVCVASVVSSGLRASGWACFHFEGDQNWCCSDIAEVASSAHPTFVEHD